MKAKRPTFLTVVAWLFILVGVVVVVNTVISAFRGSLHVNLGVLAIPAGIGLLRASVGWRSFCLCLIWLGVAGSVILAAVAVFVPEKMARSSLMIQSPYFAVLYAVASTVFYVWAFSVLQRKDVRVFFGIESDSHRNA
jgi:hypothetical protein